MSKIIITVYVLITSLALISLKWGAESNDSISAISNKVNFNINLFVIAGIFLYGFSFLLYMYLISKYDLGYIIPLTAAFIYIVVFIASFIIFKEVFTVTKVIGITLIVAGLIFLNLRNS